MLLTIWASLVAAPWLQPLCHMIPPLFLSEFYRLAGCLVSFQLGWNPRAVLQV